MPDYTVEANAAAKVYDYAHSGPETASTNAFRDELATILKSGNMSSGFSEDVNQRLIDSGTLGDLLIKDWSKVDTDNSGDVSYNESLTAYYSEDPLVAILGKAMNDGSIAGSINPETMLPGMTYDAAKKAALETPERRPDSDFAPVVPPVGDVPAGQVLPPAALTPEGTAALADLQNPALSAEGKLKAITTLVAQGQTTATIRDADGSAITVRLEVSPISEGNPKSFVHMFAVDPTTGKESVMMRAISDGTNFSKQRDANGEEIGFVGSKWMKNHPGSMFKS